MALKSKRLLVALILALLAALALALPATSVTPGEDTNSSEVNDSEVTASGGTTSCEGRRLATLKAQLTGEKEVPGPGDPDGIGTAVVKVYRAQVFFTLTVENIAPANASHIHLGLREEAGPVVATLAPPPTDGSSSACVDIPRALSLELREHPSRYYVNVHNAEFPLGAIRGQLHR
jgi:CHRD domain-containing protein